MTVVVVFRMVMEWIVVSCLCLCCRVGAWSEAWILIRSWCT